MSDVELTVVEGGIPGEPFVGGPEDRPFLPELSEAETQDLQVGYSETPVSESCCDASEPCIPSPEELAQLAESEIVEGIEDELSPDDYKETALQTAHAMAQIVQTGNKLVAILVHPGAKAGFEAAWKSLPEQAEDGRPVLPAQWRERLPIVEDPTVPGVRILTQRDLEKQFLLQFYGPRAGGGNGLIDVLDKWCEENQCPVFTSDLNFLRTKFLVDLSHRVFKEIHIPTGSELIRR